MEDSQIIELFFSRNEKALSEVQHKYGAYCQSVARNILNDARDIEESINDTWLEAWKSIPPTIPDNLAAFLGKITRNLSLNIVRKTATLKRKTDYAESYDELYEIIGNENVESECAAKELSEIINDFLEQLPEIQRKIFVCRYFYFDSINDIGQRFGYSTSKVKSTLYRTRKKLQTKLKEEDYL